MNKKKTNKEVLKFLGYLKELEVAEAVGLAYLLHVDLLVRPDGEDPDSIAAASIQEKDYNIILSEMIEAFIGCNKHKKRWILDLMKDATSAD